MYRARDRGGGRFVGRGGRGFRDGWADRGVDRGRFIGRGGGYGVWRGRGADFSSPENGYCLLHRRKRLLSDLVPMEGGARGFRCDPSRECFQRQEIEEATCHLHNRRRKVTQMREVRTGVWECLPTSLCRQFGNGPMGVPVVAPVGGGAVGGGVGRGRDRDYLPASRKGRYEGPEAASPWAPTAPSRPVQLQKHAGPGEAEDPDQADGTNPYGDRVGGRDAGVLFRPSRGNLEKKVWCARHGKHLPASECDSIGDCCFICADNTLCLSTPLDDTAALQERECKELLCTRHNTLRSVAFLKLNDDRDGYQCVRGHACRGVTLPQMQLAGANALDGGVDASGYAGHGEDDDGLAAQDAYLGAHHGTGAADAYGGEHAGREAVSSFFV